MKYLPSKPEYCAVIGKQSFPKKPNVIIHNGEKHGYMTSE